MSRIIGIMATRVIIWTQEDKIDDLKNKISPCITCHNNYEYQEDLKKMTPI